MQTWMEGYESDIEYTSGYYREQEPDFLNLCALNHGIAPVNLEKGFTYCELGCGFGMTSLIMAANYPQGKFYAIDFNPSHIARARSLATQAGLDNIVFLEKSFAQIVQEPGLLPECDFISLHGIFTWVSDENRQYIIDICTRHLKAGGMVYNSYNAKPGWSIGEPIQKMVIAAGKLFTGNSISRFDQAVAMMDQLADIGPRYFAINKDMMKSRIDLLKSKDKHYLVHEYFNEGWRAFYFTEIAEYLSAAKLEFVGDASATASYVPGLLPPQANQFLSSIPDRNVRELFQDVILNTVFRKDIYMRGIASRIDGGGQFAAFSRMRWALKKVLDEENKSAFKFKLSIGEVNGKPETYRSIVDQLEQQPLAFMELQAKTGLVVKELVQGLMFLYQEGIVGVQYTQETVLSALRLNQVFASQLFTAHKVNYLVLPAMKSSLVQGMTDMLFYRAVLATGETNAPAVLVEHVSRELEARNLYITHNGRQLAGNDMRARLVELEQVWRRQVLPVLRAGGALG